MKPMKRTLLPLLALLLVSTPSVADVVATNNLQVTAVKVFPTGWSPDVPAAVRVDFDADLSQCFASGNTKRSAYVPISGNGDAARIVQSIGTAALLSGKTVDVQIESTADASGFFSDHCRLLSLTIK